MGETLSLAQPAFNRSVHIETRPERVTSDAGFLLGADVLHTSGLISELTARLHEPRSPERIEYSLGTLIRSFVLMVMQGWGDQSDVERLRGDPLLAMASSEARGQAAAGQRLASQPTLARLLDILASEPNQAVMDGAAMELAGKRLRAANRGHRRARITIDIDGLPLTAHGEQPGSAYNGHVGERVHYPLVASCAQTGDLLGGRLRCGDASPAEGIANWLTELIAQARRHLAQRIQVRLDAGFCDGATLDALEAEGVGYVVRLRTNQRLQRLFDPHRNRGPGRPAEHPREWTVETSYAADSWPHQRRVVMVVQEHPAELFRQGFFIVTNLPASTHSGDRVLALYRRRGKAEAHMGELKSLIGESLPCTTTKRTGADAAFARNQVLLSLRVLAYQLMHTLRCPMERITGHGWSLRRLRERVLKAAARLQRSGRRLVVILERRAAAHWQALFNRLQRWPPTPA